MKLSMTILAVACVLGITPHSRAAEVSTQIVTTTTTKGTKNKPATVTTNKTTITSKSEPRQVLTEGDLKNMSPNNLCVDGFKPYVGNDTKNVCQSKATTPDIAYSCVWKQDDSDSAYQPTEKGPCTLDFAEHKGSITILKNDFASNPPLSYGSEAQCCYRAAQDPVTTIIESNVMPTSAISK